MEDQKEKYLVCPGEVKSLSDGDIHYISSQQLIELYRVNPLECKIVTSPDSARGIILEDFIVLRPNTAGDYSLPTK